jgi:hypothetical protein
MRIGQNIKKIKWLLQNQEKIEAFLVEKDKKSSKNDDFSFAGVPDFQKEYVIELLKKEK